LDITTRTSLVGFLLALSTLHAPEATAVATAAPIEPTIEARLTRLSSALQERANLLPDTLTADQRVAIGWGDGSGRDWANGRGRGWADGSGDRGWANTRGGGWADGSGGGGWANVNPWRNGWADGGAFYNHRY
jgi:rSAM-associated Gly-rich repeat protein